MASLGSPEIIGILILFLLLFGVERLPKLARSLGQAKQEFHHGMVEAADSERISIASGDGQSAAGDTVDVVPSELAERAKKVGLSAEGVDAATLEKRVTALEKMDE